MAKAPETLGPSVWHPELLAGPLRSKRLTVLYCAPSPLRDGMLRRGLMPLLQQPLPAHGRAAPRHPVPIRFDNWGALPLVALRARIDAEFKSMWPNGPPETLAAHLHAVGRQHHATVLLVLDAFERHLNERAERADIERFDIELAECITHDSVPMHVLMVVDELEHRALQRYSRKIANFGNDFLRLPALHVDAADPTPWSDTDIEAPPTGIDDEHSVYDDDVDWSVDLSLDLAPADEAAASEAPRAMAPSVAMPAPAPVAATPPAPATAPPAPAVAPPIVTPPAPPSVASSPAFGTTSVTPPATPSVASSPAFATAPGTASIAAPPPRAAPAAPAPEPAIGAWPPIAPPQPAPPPRSVPPWLTEADVQTMRRMQQERAPRWPALLGLAVYMTVLLGGAWLVARWIIDSNRVEPHPRAAQPPVSTDVPRPDAPAAKAPPAAPPAPAAQPPMATPTTQAKAPGTALTPPSRTLTLALPPDAGSAVPIIDELVQRVAAPAGLELRMAAGNERASLTLWRGDVLLAARAANGPPLQVVAPLFDEQIQVLVRNDARWDYVREIKGLRLNIGPPDGARARTVRALYQQLFGTPLPAAQVNELDLETALQQLRRRGGPIDAVVVVSESPLEPQLQPALRRQVRELTLDARHASSATALPGFSISRRTPADLARLSVTNFLVALGAPPRPHDGALRALAAALCRAQPTLQAQRSPLLRGLRQGQQPAVGWTYVLPQTPGAACPAA